MSIFDREIEAFETNFLLVLVAPPPKMATPRRINMNGNQDLFGSDPFHPIQPKSSFNVSIRNSTSFSTSHVSISNPLNNLATIKQEFNGLDFSDEPRNVAKDLSALSFQINRFEDDLSDKIDDFSTKSEGSRNPFLIQSDAPKKPSTKLFPKPSDMIMGSKNNKYDVFKNEITSGKEEPAAPMPSAKQNAEVNPDLFKDFAIAAFSEFKVDKKSSLIHEFSNRLSDQKNIQQMKVNS